MENKNKKVLPEFIFDVEIPVAHQPKKSKVKNKKRFSIVEMIRDKIEEHEKYNQIKKQEEYETVFQEVIRVTKRILKGDLYDPSLEPKGIVKYDPVRDVMYLPSYFESSETNQDSK